MYSIRVSHWGLYRCLLALRFVLRMLRAVSAVTEHIVSGDSSLMLCNPAIDGVQAAWLDPEFWGQQACPVAIGGRGGASFVHADVGELVLREYLRGGMMARLSRRSYLFTGFDHCRPMREFRLLQRLRTLGLPVPEPVAAVAERNGPLTYRAAILMRRIADAVPLPTSPALCEPALWRRIGALLARFHAAGLDHVDLNCDNLLHAPNGIWLIDLDRCRLRPPALRWQQANLLRLQRSVEKRCAHLPALLRTELWAALLQGYGGAH